MKRRTFIAGLGAAAAWPLAARAQQRERLRRVGVLRPGPVYDQEEQARVAGLEDGLKSLGWIAGRNLQLETRYSGGDSRAIDAYAEELVRLAPDVIVVGSGIVTTAVQKRTQTIPIVFTGLGDPVANGVVKSLSHPNGNITGITNLYPSIGGKWMELLKDIAPSIARAASLVSRNSSGQYIAPVEAAAANLGVEAETIRFSSWAELEAAVEAFASKSNAGVILSPPGLAVGDDRQRFFQLVAKHRLPAVYADRFYTLQGGLISYGSDEVARYRQAAIYVDRLLRGAKPGDLPIQFPNKFDLVINLKTAKALGLNVSRDLLSLADEVIE
jgi:putative ABC transport system substrate-binding protein